MKNTIAEESWRYGPDERVMMADVGIVVIPETIASPAPSAVVVDRAQAEFQRSFMRVTHSDGTVTDGNGQPVIRRRM